MTSVDANGKVNPKFEGVVVQGNQTIADAPKNAVIEPKNAKDDGKTTIHAGSPAAAHTEEPKHDAPKPAAAHPADAKKAASVPPHHDATAPAAAHKAGNAGPTHGAAKDDKKVGADAHSTNPAHAEPAKKPDPKNDGKKK